VNGNGRGEPRSFVSVDCRATNSRGDLFFMAFRLFRREDNFLGFNKGHYITFPIKGSAPKFDDGQSGGAEMINRRSAHLEISRYLFLGQ